MFQTKVVERIRTRILCSVAFTEDRSVFKTMWKNTVQPDMPQMTI